MSAVVWIAPVPSRDFPHITLLYPFVARNAFSYAIPRLQRVCSDFPSFTVRLSRVERFPYGQSAWVSPEPAEPFRKLQAALQAEFPLFDDVSRHPGGFVPHLTVGENWKPVEIAVTEIALIRRRRIEKTFRLQLSNL